MTYAEAILYLFCMYVSEIKMTLHIHIDFLDLWLDMYSA